MIENTCVRQVKWSICCENVKCPFSFRESDPFLPFLLTEQGRPIVGWREKFKPGKTKFGLKVKNSSPKYYFASTDKDKKSLHRHDSQVMIAKDRKIFLY